MGLGVSKGVLASRLSITPETFWRVTKQLVTDGVIVVNGAHVTGLDRAGLTLLLPDRLIL